MAAADAKRAVGQEVSTRVCLTPNFRGTSDLPPFGFHSPGSTAASNVSLVKYYFGLRFETPFPKEWTRLLLTHVRHSVDRRL